MSISPSRRTVGLAAVCLLTLGVLASPMRARQAAPAAPRTYTSADYSRAEKFLTAATTPLVSRLTVQPTWLADGRFWYRNTDGTATETVVVDPVARRRSVCAPDLSDCRFPGIPAVEPVGAAAGRGRAGGGGGRGGGAQNQV